MRHYLCVLYLICCWFSNGNSQEKPNCLCPENDSGGTIPDTIFAFSNGKQIAVCGHKNDEGQPISYSEFALAVCGEKGVVDFWDATQTCDIKMDSDTLKVTSLVNLPVGNHFEFRQTNWTIEKFYFLGKALTKSTAIDNAIPKYSQAQINSVLKDYKTSGNNLSDQKIELANRLFIAAISGSKTAGKYLSQFDDKFKSDMDGAFAEEYKALAAMFGLWKKLNH